MDEKLNYTENLKKVLFLAEKLAETYGSSYIASEHFLFAMLIQPECKAYKILSDQGISAEKYEDYFVRTIDSRSNIKGYTPRTKNIVRSAEDMSKRTGTDHLLHEIVKCDSCIAVRILRCMGTDFHKLAIGIAYSLNSEAEQ